MEIQRYEVINANGKTVGYLERQGEDSRLVDTDGETRLQSFFPWKQAIAWTKEKGHRMRQLSTSEPVAVLNE